MKRYDMRKILADPIRRRQLIAESTVVTMRREGIHITLKQALKSYDEVTRERIARCQK